MANGHRLDEVWGYTLRQLQVFVDLVKNRRRQELKDMAITVRMAQGAEQKKWNEFMAQLEEKDDAGGSS